MSKSYVKIRMPFSSAFCCSAYSQWLLSPVTIIRCCRAHGVDKEYLAYGPLLKALEGRTWVLTPHAAEVENNVAQANMFSVPGGFTIVIALGGLATSARVVVSGVHNP